MPNRINNPLEKKGAALKPIPIVAANWKMAMKLDEVRTFVREFEEEMGDLIGKMQVVLTAPTTAMSTLAKAVKDLPLVDPAAQNSSAHRDPEHSGEISAELLAAGLRPFILVGESETDKGTPADDLVERMEKILDGVTAEQISRSLMVYEPEWAIGADEPAAPDYIAERATFMRNWLIDRYGEEAVRPIPIIYGGAVFPENAEWLLSTPDIDGLGAGRKSRNGKEFASIAKIVAKAFDLL